MGVDDSREVDLAAFDGLLQDGSNPGGGVSAVRSAPQERRPPCRGGHTHSGGLAGSMMTASLLFSSVTR